MTLPTYLQQTNQVDDPKFQSIILVEPTPQPHRCVSCSSDAPINLDMHCVVCAEKNRAFNTYMIRKQRAG